MTNILRIPANSQAYLWATRDSSRDKFDVRRFAYDFKNVAAFPDPWAYWKMDETSGTRVDSTGNGRHLTVGDVAPSSGAGKVSNALRLVGNHADNVYLDGPVLFEFTGTTQFTFAFWLRITWGVDTLGSEFNLLSYFGCSIHGYGDDYDQNWVDAGFSYVGPPFTGCYVESPTAFDDGWHWIVIYHDGVGLHLDIDNAEVDYDANPHVLTTFDPLEITMYGDTADDIVNIDEYGIWDVALTADQRTYLWNDGSGRTLYP